MEEAIKAMPSNPQCYFSLGVMLGRLQRLQVSVHNNPLVEVLEVVVSMVCRSGIFCLQEAEELLRTAISMNSAPNYHANLGNQLMNTWGNSQITVYTAVTNWLAN